MKIWIINPYGTLPSEGWREYRSSMLAKALANRGHEVTWWISDFEHRSKSYRKCGELNDPLLPQGVRIISIHSSPYAKNISMKRIRYEISFGKEFACLAKNESIPDAIVLGDPSLFFSAPVVAYRNKVGCSLILDVIDLWPELFTLALPKPLQPIGKLIFSPLYQRRKKLISNCDAVAAVSHDYLDTVLRSQKRKIPSQVAYLGINTNDQDALPINPVLDEKLRAFKSRFSLTVVYAGTLGDAYDMDILLAAVHRIDEEKRNIGFLVAGDGPRKPDMVAATKRYPDRFLFLGSLPPNDLKTLYANSDVGLMTYLPGSTVALPVKFFDYLAGGLAILSSLERDVKKIIKENNIGLNYTPSNLDDFLQKVSYYEKNIDILNETKRLAKSLSSEYNSNKQHNIFSKFIEDLIYIQQ